MKNIFQLTLLLAGLVTPLFAHPSSDGTTGASRHARLVARAPAVTNMQVAMWDLGYMDLRTGESKLYEISKDGGEKAKGQKATGTLKIKTEGLATCAALAIAGSGGALLGHFPPVFCQFLAGTPIADKTWAAKAKQMQTKLAKTLSVNRAALSGGHVVIIRGYASTGNTAVDQLNRMLHAAGITPAAQVVQSQMGTSVESRSAVVGKLPSGTAHIWVDGRML